MPDPGGTVAGWFPAVTTILGFFTASLLEFFRDQRTTQREREARKATKQAQLLEKRTAFQRETLINLQDAITKLTRTTGRMSHLNEVHYRDTGRWEFFPFPEGLSDESLQANVVVTVLISRVRDPGLRELVTSLRNHTSNIGIARSRELERTELDKMAVLLPRIHDHIGELLRKLDDDDDANMANI